MFIEKIYIFLFFELFILVIFLITLGCIIFISKKRKEIENIIKSNFYYKEYIKILSKNEKYRKSYNIIQKKLLESKNINTIEELKIYISKLEKQIDIQKNKINETNSTQDDLLTNLENMIETNIILLHELESQKKN